MKKRRLDTMSNRTFISRMILSLVITCLMIFPCVALADAIPESLSLNQTSITLDLAKDDEFNLDSVAYPATADQDVEWETDSSSIARVSYRGVVTPRKVGTTTVRAVSERSSKVYAECVVTVIDTRIPEAIELNYTEVTLDLGKSEKIDLNAIALPSIADQDVEWSTSSSSIVRVSSSGVLTPRKIGTTTVKAVSERSSKVYAVCTVTVIDTRIPASIMLSKSAVTIDLAASEKTRLSSIAYPSVADPSVDWSTRSSSIVRVSSDGVLTPKKIGTTTVRATSERSSKVYAECVVTVIDSRIPTSISFPEYSEGLTLDRYQTFQLTPLVEPAIADKSVKWKTSSSSIVSVSSSGVLTAKKAGTATITCYSTRSSSIKTTLKVTVKQYPTPDSISLDKDTAVMVLGDTLQLTPTTYPLDEQVCSYFDWKTSSSSRASVSSDGVVTAKKTGWVTITCASKQSSKVKDTVEILIVSATSPHYIHIYDQESGDLLDNQTITLNPTDRLQLTGEVLPEGKDPNIVWKSSRTSVATVDGTGMVYARKAGSVTISAVSKVNSQVLASFKINVVNLPAPDEILLSAPMSTIEITDKLQLTATTLPLGEKRSQEFDWSVSSSSTASISSDGLLTPKKIGTVTVTVKSERNSRVKATFVVRIIDSNLPDSVTLAESGTITIETGQKLPLHATVTPATAIQTLRWTSSKTSRATVDQNGVVTGVSSGTVTISAISTYNSDRKDTVSIKVVSKSAPTALSLSTQQQMVLAGESTQLTLTPTPSSASVLGTYTTSNASVATVDENGLVTTHGTGTAVITFISLKNSAVRATLPIVVYDENTPGSISLSDSVLYLVKGDNGIISGSVFPATAPQDIIWDSSNSSIVTVSPDGTLKAKGTGTAYISGTTTNGLSARCEVNVISTYVATAIPARRTSISGIEENLRKIYAIRDSAKDQVTQLLMNGEINSSEVSERHEIIERAFEMQAFPWMTPAYQPYWTDEYAYKSYEPGYVYYGLPYIQKGKTDSYKNREYNVAKALKENRYLDSGNGYYLLNQNNLLETKYVGNDCSAFIGISMLGINHSSAFIRTRYLTTSSYYETIKHSEMRPGDMMVLHNSHTVMFLYWVDTAHTKMMIIEQGGDGNTVICSIHDLSYYTSQGYIARRRAALN